MIRLFTIRFWRITPPKQRHYKQQKRDNQGCYSPRDRQITQKKLFPSSRSARNLRPCETVFRWSQPNQLISCRDQKTFFMKGDYYE